MIIKEKPFKKLNNIINLNISKKNSHFDNIHKNKDPAFQVNKTLINYIYNKLKINNNNPNIRNKDDRRINNIKIKVNKNIGYSKLNKHLNFSPRNNNDYIYYKKNSKILLFLKNHQNAQNGNIFNMNKSSFSDNNTFSSTYNDFMYHTIKNNNKTYNGRCLKKSSTCSFSNTISYREMNNYKSINNNNRNELSKTTLLASISQDRLQSSLSPRMPYRKVGNIFNRSECQFSKNKIKNNCYVKNKLLKKNKSQKYYHIISNNKKDNIDNENYNKENIDKIKKLEGENLYLKDMIKKSEEKLTIRENQLEELLMLHSQIEDKMCSIPMKEIKNIDSPIIEIIKRKEIFNKENINNNNRNYKNKNIKKNKKENIYNGIILYDYLDEPLEQIAPKPYHSNFYNNNY